MLTNKRTSILPLLRLTNLESGSHNISAVVFYAGLAKSNNVYYLIGLGTSGPCTRAREQRAAEPQPEPLVSTS